MGEYTRSMCHFIFIILNFEAPKNAQYIHQSYPIFNSWTDV